jgi:hypothetical protein
MLAHFVRELFARFVRELFARFVRELFVHFVRKLFADVYAPQGTGNCAIPNYNCIKFKVRQSFR